MNNGGKKLLQQMITYTESPLREYVNHNKKA
jgi:hypothetical protein